MTVKNLKNVAASVRQKLLNKARTGQRSFEEIARMYAMERFLYRLGFSRYRKKFVLKGALMFRVWKDTVNRPTMDIDLLGLMSNDPTLLENAIRDICAETVEADGLFFDAASVKSESITSGAEYVGRRILFLGHLENMRIPMQLDIGFGDKVFPAPEEAILPSILGYSSPVLIGYTRESAIAEKFHAMMEMGELNSRMKDFYDIWLLSRTFEFRGELLEKAIQFTFGKRKSSYADEIIAFGETFAMEKQAQWAAFAKKLYLKDTPGVLVEIIVQIKTFILPVITALIDKSNPPSKWTAPGPWKR
jgi:hypothetical protein